MLTTGEADLPKLISRLQEEAKHLRRELAQNMAQLMEYEAQALLRERTECGPYLLLTKTFCDRSPKDLKLLTNILLEHASNTIILFGSTTNEKASLFFSRSQDVPMNMNTLMKAACSVLNGRGGGPPHQAQGGGTEVGKLDEAIDQALAALNLQTKEL
jgi:alanyl-tRNA synthetase